MSAPTRLLDFQPTTYKLPFGGCYWRLTVVPTNDDEDEDGAAVDVVLTDLVINGNNLSQTLHHLDARTSSCLSNEHLNNST